eukprot:gene30864-35908_t
MWRRPGLAPVHPLEVARVRDEEVEEEKEEEGNNEGEDDDKGKDGDDGGGLIHACRREDAELRQREDDHLKSRPATIEGYKSSPVWTLKRHITKYQALRPGSRPAGMHKGEAVFLRSDVSELHTADRWLREGRRVQGDQVDKPFKVVKKRAQPPPRDNGGRPSFGYQARLKQGQAKEDLHADDGDEDMIGDGPIPEAGEGPTSSLYGMWQTDRYRAVAENGKVPKNSRGNVECPPFTNELPVGTVHLQYNGLGPICRSMGIDFATALVGFEVQAGRMVPRIDGVVVCEVVAEYVVRETKKQEEMARRRRAAAKSAWFQLIQLDADYTKEHPKGKAAVLASTDVVDLSLAEDGEEGEQAAKGPGARELMLQRLQEEHGGGSAFVGSRVGGMQVDQEEI